MTREEWLAREQRRIRKFISLEDGFDKVEYIAGADVAYSHIRACAAVAVLSYLDQHLVDLGLCRVKLEHDYRSGYLALREELPILCAFSRLKVRPDLLIIEAHGIAHPRGAGLASSIGVKLDLPTIGCAKSLLFGDFENLGEPSGSCAPIRDGDRVIGYALRTRDHTRPLFVSTGHRVSLESCRKVVTGCLRGFRLPEPLRLAHHFSRLYREEWFAISKLGVNERAKQKGKQKK
jgi:deoxyribonuclease V